MTLRKMGCALTFSLGAFIVGASPALAQEAARGFASSTFQRAEVGSRFFSLDTLDLRGNGRMALGVIGNYGYRPVVDYASDGTVSRSIVQNQLVSHFGAAFVFADSLRLGLEVPLTLYTDGGAQPNAIILGRTYPSPSDLVAVGDVRMAADVRLFGRHGDGVTGAVGAALHVPSGRPLAYTGDGEPRITPRFLLAGSTRGVTWAAKAAFMIRGRDEPFIDGRIGSELQVGAAGGLRLARDRIVLGPELTAATVVSQGAAFEGRTTPVEALLGAHVDAVENMRFSAGAGAGLTRAHGTPVFRALLGLEWVPGSATAAAEKKKEAGPDRDGDGVPDADDACGYVAGARSEVAERNGCPVLDADGDGVPDDQDACRQVWGERQGPPDRIGCPGDRDADGVLDPQDACPEERGGRSANPARNGCPSHDDPSSSPTPPAPTSVGGGEK